MPSVDITGNAQINLIFGTAESAVESFYAGVQKRVGKRHL